MLPTNHAGLTNHSAVLEGMFLYRLRLYYDQAMLCFETSASREVFKCTIWVYQQVAICTDEVHISALDYQYMHRK